MKPFRFAAALVVLVAGCASSSPPDNNHSAQPDPAATDTYILHTAPGDTASRPPRLTVGTSYSDTQLILPWFLNDIINFVNYR
jgi:hypothetical protein